MRLISLGSIASGLAIVALAVSMTACSTFEKAIGEDKAAPVRTYAEYVFEGFRSGWVPALKSYRTELPQCSAVVKAPCWSEGSYAKLHAVTAAALSCMTASTAPGVPLVELQLCITKVEGAKTVFLQEGVKPEEAGS